MALPNYKEILDLIKKGANLEAQEKIIELREAALMLQEENHQLKAELSDLKQEIEIRNALKFDGEVYFSDDGLNGAGPYCPGCYDSNRKLIRVHKFEGMYSGPQWHCKICDKFYERRPN